MNGLLRRLLLTGLGAACLLAASCSDDDDCEPPPTIAVLGAFPGELEALVARAQVDEEIPFGDKVMRRGTLGGMPVVVGMTGIGLINATETTQAVLDAFDIGGIVMSGVAGSPHNVGDVTVPDAWFLIDDATYVSR